MNKVAFIFIHGPHGKSSGREGLDALLATSIMCEETGVFFISDGILLLLSNQKPTKILAHNFLASFGVLSFYNINNFYLCLDSASERGIDINTNLILDVKWISAKAWRQELTIYDIIITF